MAVLSTLHLQSQTQPKSKSDIDQDCKFHYECQLDLLAAKTKRNKKRDFVKTANYRTPRLSHWKPLPWPLPVNGMCLHCVNAELENQLIQTIAVLTDKSTDKLMIHC